MKDFMAKRAGARGAQGAWALTLAFLLTLFASMAQGRTFWIPYDYYDGNDSVSGATSREFTIPPDVHWITVELWGGGGAGGAGASGKHGGGGAGGQYARKTFQVTSGSKYKISPASRVGSNSGNGPNGQDTVLRTSSGTVIALAKGGEGGKSGANGGAGGNGSTAGGIGDVVRMGGKGSAASSSASGAGGGGAGGDAIHLGTATLCSTSAQNGKNASGTTGGGNSCYCGGRGGNGSTTNAVNAAPSGSGIANDATMNCVWGSQMNANSQNVFGGGGGGAYKNNSGTLNGGNGGRGRVYIFADKEPITLSKTAASASVLADTIVPFTLSAKNNIKDTLKGLVVTDNLPAGMVYVSHDSPSRGSVSVNGNSIKWTLDLPANATESLRINVKVTAKGTLTNKINAPGAKEASVSVRVVDKVDTHFRMDETAGSWQNNRAGDVLDSGGQGMHAKLIRSGGSSNVITPSVTIATQHPGIQGGYCNAGNFDGSARVEVPHNAHFDYKTKMSASVWVYVNSIPSTDAYGILSNEPNYELTVKSNGKLSWWWFAGGVHELQAPITARQWTHVAVTFDKDDKHRLYINGEEKASYTWNGALVIGNCPLIIGSDVEGNSRCTLMPGRNFRGMIDEVKLYGYPLTKTEVEADMTLGRQCEAFDHIRIEHGTGSPCAPEAVTIKACVDATCSALYQGNVTVNLLPATGWDGGNIRSFTGGQTVVKLSETAAGPLGTNNVAPAVKGATRCFRGSVESCARDNSNRGICEFDAVEIDAARPSNLFTKLAGVSFTLDLLALNPGTKAINPSFTGDAYVELVDANKNCAIADTLLSSQKVTYASSEKGRKKVNFTYNGARKARVRAKKTPAGQPSCSVDIFAIRPQAITVSAPLASADTAGNSSTATPTIKAGAPFELVANTGIVGYDGSPKLNPALIEWPGAPGTGLIVGQINGAVPGQLAFTTSATIANGNGAKGNFTYDETGYFRFKPYGVYDDSFVDLSGDKANGDCISGSFSNSLSNGRYGCNFGNTAVSDHFGRFIPDHFETAVDQACQAGSFTYSGQPFPLTVTAKNRAGSTCLNYSGNFARTVTLRARDVGDTLDNPGPGSLNPAAMAGTAFTAGIGRISPAYRFTQPETSPEAVRLRAGDGEAISDASEGIAEIRSGRAFLGTTYGSEQNDLAVPFRVEYFSGSGWTQNTDDQCTGNTVPDAQNAVSVTLTAPPGLATCVYDASGLSGNHACASSANPLKDFINGTDSAFTGNFNLWLKAPGKRGTVQVDATVPPWLGAPSSNVSFGHSKSPIIYRRENY